jgi:hypothetical protein
VKNNYDIPYGPTMQLFQKNKKEKLFIGRCNIYQYLFPLFYNTLSFLFESMMGLHSGLAHQVHVRDP